MAILNFGVILFQQTTDYSSGWYCSKHNGLMETVIFIPTLIKSYRRLFECLMYYN